MIKQVARGLAAGAVLAASIAGLSAAPAMATACADKGYRCIEYYAEPQILFKSKREAEAQFPRVQANCRRNGGTVVSSKAYPFGSKWQTVVLCRVKV